MPRLRTVSPHDRGWTRRRAGRGFSYVDHRGERLAADDVDRIKALVIPPAWEDVWICPYASGHIQAVGTDAAGRRQYLYHPLWREQRDALKFDRVQQAARRLPGARERMLADLSGDGMGLERAAATAVRLLDLGYFRIGSDAYAQGGSFGLTTLERRHVRRRGETLVFRFVGKSGIEHLIEIDDAAAIESVDRMRRRRGGSPRLMAYLEGRRWSDLSAGMVNDYLRQTTGEEITAKDFRTWHATVLAAVSLAESDESGETKASRNRAKRRAAVEVSEFLGNTPTIARNSYIDPRVMELYDDGVTIESACRRTHPDAASRQAALERAVLRMLKGA
ncbi:DNA topoisomerase IB [Alteromonas gracilis]